MTFVRRFLAAGRAEAKGKPAGLRSRLPRIVMAAMGVALLAGAIFSTAGAGRDSVLANLDNALSSDAVLRASALEEYFERAQSIELLLANDTALGQFEPGRAHLSGPQFDAASLQAAKTMTYLQELYPGRISEACLIDDTGTELARVVRGKIAPASELSTEEAKTPFFAPTLQLPKGQVHQAAPYVSPDTHEWVISNSTPLVSASGRKWGMAHFEVVLDTFRPGAQGVRTRFTDLIVDNRTGRILLDSEQPLVGTAALGREGSAGLRALVGAPGSRAAATVDGHRMAVARVPVQQDNENSWSVVVVAPIEAGGWSGAIGPAPLATALAALLLLAFARFNLRASRRAERRGEARYRSLIAQSADLVLVCDSEGRVSYLSPAAEWALASPNADGAGLGQQVDQFAHPEDKELLRALLEPQATGDGIADLRLGRTAQECITYEVSVRDLTCDPNVLGLVLTCHDVTQARALDKAKSDFVATVSHELRTPLTSIRGYMELLAEGDFGALKPAQRKAMAVIDRNAARLLGLVNELLTLADMGDGSRSRVVAAVDLSEIVTATGRALDPLARAGDIRVILPNLGESAVVAGNAEQLERVVVNLMSNAVKFTPEGGRVGVTVGATDSTVVLCVQDTGIGIPVGEQGHLFTKFFRSSFSQQHEIQGTGLGLAVCSSIIEAHHGTIAIESEPGAGTCVTVTLPRFTEPSQERQPPEGNRVLISAAAPPSVS